MQNIFALKYWSEKQKLKKSGGTLDRLSSLLKKSAIDLHPYQIQSALYAFNSPLARGCILADEVGLGKTIEAGLVIAQLVLEGKNVFSLLRPPLCVLSGRVNYRLTLVSTRSFSTHIFIIILSTKLVALHLLIPRSSFAHINLPTQCTS